MISDMTRYLDMIWVECRLNKYERRMWELQSSEGIKVYVFEDLQNTDNPKKHSIGLFSAYEELSEMAVGDVLTWRQTPIRIGVVKSGEFWNLTIVAPWADQRPDPRFRPNPERVRQSVIEWARWISRPLFVDTVVYLDQETTGLEAKDPEIVSACVKIRDMQGRMHTYFDEQIRPPNPDKLLELWDGKTSAEITGLTPDSLKDKPVFEEISAELKARLDNNLVLIYNADYDWPLLEKHYLERDLIPPSPLAVVCVMKQFARYRGVWSDKHQSFTFCKLSEALEYMKIDPGQYHNAPGDVDAMAALVEAMAKGKVEGL